MLHAVALVLLGLAGGVLSGLVGIGGGIIIVPALVVLFGLSQHAAQGTTLAAFVPPVGALAAWVYYQAGHVDLRVAAWICLGFVVGGMGGAKIATLIPALTLQRLFGAVLLVVAIKMIFGK